jgi:hypothetical protein
MEVEIQDRSELVVVPAKSCCQQSWRLKRITSRLTPAGIAFEHHSPEKQRLCLDIGIASILLSIMLKQLLKVRENIHFRTARYKLQLPLRFHHSISQGMLHIDM